MTDPTAKLLAASRFASASLLGPNFHFPDELAKAINLSSAGERLRVQLKEKRPTVSEGDISAALLGRFCAASDILIDCETSSIEDVFQILSKEIAERRINYPFVFGRSLHDQFIDNFGAIPINSLTPEQTQRLITLTPQGVFQLEEWVSGPYGLIRSIGRRYLPPQACGPAIRCTQVGCNKLHHVMMRTSDTDAGNLYDYIGKNYPTSVDLLDKITDILLPDDEFYRVNHPGGLPWLIGNGFTQDELSRLAEHVLGNNIRGLRERVNSLIGGSAPRRPPAFIVRSLSHAALMQILLLVDDASLVESLETIIDEELIELSPTEVRRSFENRHLNGGNFRVGAEASRLGVRFVPKSNLTEPRMLAVIRAVFSGDYGSALDWQLRNEAGADSLEKLEKCLDEQDPHDLLRRLFAGSA